MSEGGRTGSGRKGLSQEAIRFGSLDQDRDLSPNAAALIELLSDLGLATQFSDGLVMCHSKPRF